MYFKFQKKEKFLYVFDLAGSEKLTDILSHNYNNEESNQQLKNIQTTTLSNNIMELLTTIYGKYITLQNTSQISLNSFTNYLNEKIKKLKLNAQEENIYKLIARHIKNYFFESKVTQITIEDFIDKFDIIRESVFIDESLEILKEKIGEFKQRYKENKQFVMNTLNLNIENLEKIIIIGYLRNDVNTKTNAGAHSKVIDYGNESTLNFLDSLNPEAIKQQGGTIESPRHLLTETTPFQPKQLLLEPANKVTESALEPLIVGGGIIDKTVQDADRSIVIMVTFFITFLSTYMKNTLSDKGVLKNKTEEMVTLVAFYSFFTLLFASLIELGSVDTMYMLTYLLAFGIIYITLNTYQEPKKRSLIKDRIEGEVIQEYKEMDNNLLISWMMSSIGVIFV